MDELTVSWQDTTCTFFIRNVVRNITYVVAYDSEDSILLNQ